MDSPKMNKRTFYFGVIIVMIFMVLASRLAFLQIVQGRDYYQQAENNRIDFKSIGAPRGKIFTTNGDILVSNKMAYSVSLKLKELEEEQDVKKVIAGLTDKLQIDNDEIINKMLKEMIDGKVLVKDNLNSEEKTLLTENMKKLPGMKIEQELDEEENVVREYLILNLRNVNTINLKKSCHNLADLFEDINYQELVIKVIDKGYASKEIVLIKRNLTQEEMVILEESSSELPGIVIEKVSIRDYVYDSLGSHIIGYMGAISKNELQRYSDLGYKGNDYIGKTGLEKEYEKYLRGQNGREEIEVDRLNHRIRTLKVNSPLPGANIFINVDIELQKKVEEILEQNLAQLRDEAKNDPETDVLPTGGAVIVMNPKNGKILSMTSKPNFDLNLFANGISFKDLQRLNTDERKPFLNRAIKPQYTGSIFKLVTATAALEENVITKDTIVEDKYGVYRIGKYSYKNWTWRPFGELDVIDAIAHSNNIFFYKVAHQMYNQGMGGLTVPKYAREFGLGKKTGIDLPEEEAGLVPDKDWKQRKKGTIWLPGNSLHLSIGQGDLMTTPLQLINYVSAIGNGGKLYRPYIVDRIESYDGDMIREFEPEVIGELPLSKKNLRTIRDGMLGVTTYGTATKYFEDMPMVIGGKTGTAQTGHDTNHGWFAGLAPFNDPEIAVLVFVENGMSSSNAVPIAKQIIKYYFDLPDPPKEDEEKEENQEGSEIINQNQEDTENSIKEDKKETKPEEETDEKGKEDSEEGDTEENPISDKLNTFFQDAFSSDGD